MSSKMSKWIQKANIKKGALSKQLNISESEDIPVSLLQQINRSESGTIIKNPTKKGKRTIKVTALLKQRATLALTLKKIKKP